MARYVNLLAGAAALAAIAAAFPAGAAVFSDDFEANPLTALNTAPIGWTMSDGTVDIVKTGDGFGITCNPGTCIDMDGSTGDAGRITTIATFGADDYVLSFDLSGNQRTADLDTVNVFLGVTPVTSITLAGGAGFTHYAFAVTGSGAIAFEGVGGDNIGLILDNVELVTTSTHSVVPEPGTLAILGGSLAAFGLMRRRRRSS